ncbi:MAG: DUF192 domain-containing protein [bacterium]|nr:DUF192 domain-containing protein [bacterium]
MGPRRKFLHSGTRRCLVLVACLSLAAAAVSALGAEPPGERLLRILDASTGRPKVTLRVEVARTFTEKVRGLQGRDGLEPGRGMLFLYPKAAPRSFWMKGVAFPIDLVFADGEGLITEVLEDLPPCAGPVVRCPSYRSGSPARYALELAAGQADAHGLGPGDRLELAP